MTLDEAVPVVVELMKDYGVLEHRHTLRRASKTEMEIQFDDYFAILVRMPEQGRDEDSQLIFSCYAASIRKYGLDLMERVGSISLPRDVLRLTETETGSVYMAWLKLQKEWALERVRGNMEVG